MLYSHTIKLVRFYEGADGLKTGFTDNAGYTMVTTAKRNNMRLIAVALGEEISKTRNEEITNLLDYGFNNYKVDIVKEKGEIVDTINIKKSNKENVNIVVKNNLLVLNRKSEKSIKYDTKITLNEIKLPIRKNSVVGKIEVIDNGKILKSGDLIIEEDIYKVGYFTYLYNNLKNIFQI